MRDPRLYCTGGRGWALALRIAAVIRRARWSTNPKLAKELFLYKADRRSALVYVYTASTMTVLAVFAYGFIAFGPVAALFAVTVACHAHEVIIMMAS